MIAEIVLIAFAVYELAHHVSPLVAALITATVLILGAVIALIVGRRTR